MLIELATVGGGIALLRPGRQRRGARALLRATRQPPPPARVDAGQLVRDLHSALFGEEREAQQRGLEAPAAGTTPRATGQVRRNLALSGTAIGLGLLATVSPVFYVLGSLAVLYLGRDVFQLLLADFRRRHFVSVYMMSAVLMLGMVATGHLLVAAVAGALGGFVARLIRRAEASSARRLVSVFAGHPAQVWLERDGVEVAVAFASLQPGDRVVVNAGEVIPVDGVIAHGSASIDQHLLTGESQPVERAVGELVFAATLVLTGRISVTVTTAGEATVAANIGQVLNNTRRYTDDLMLRGRQVADRLLPVELAAGVVTLGLLGPAAALAVLWSGLGYRMIVFGPISVLNYLQILSRQGILVKDGRVLEALGRIDTVVFDKTGTLTLEQPTVCAVHLLATYDEATVLQAAASAEHRQPHPLARAIVAAAAARGIAPAAPEQAHYVVGYGIRVQTGGRQVRVGSARFLAREGLSLSPHAKALQTAGRARGQSLVFVAIDDTVAGALVLEPSVRPEAQGLITLLKQRGIATCIISGDHAGPTRAIAERLGVDRYFAETLPAQKADLIRQLRADGRFVCFIGDGINDAIALKSAQVSISLQGASTAATDTAQVVFMDGTLAPLARLLQFADEFERTMRTNLRLSIAPGVINIAGVYLLHFGVALSMGLFYSATAAGLVNSVLPLVRHQQTPAPRRTPSPRMAADAPTTVPPLPRARAAERAPRRPRRDRNRPRPAHVPHP